MDDMYKLLFFTPTVQKPLGEVLDKDLKNIQNFLDGINILTLKMAQLKYNERIKNNNLYMSFIVISYLKFNF